ncbi:MAG: hypothetical protein HOO67_02375 [Candidatus Peribacteraceae bacterium]|nr:hypothetical protein [Candidatus Peribacteraceae bacterium]
MKPTIVHVEDQSSDFEQMQRDALSHFLEKDCGYRTVHFRTEHHFQSSIDQIQRLMERELLMCVLVAETKFEDELHECQRLVVETRDKLGSIPVIIMPYLRTSVAKVSENDPHTFVLDRHSKELQERLREYADRVIGSTAFRRAQTHESRSMLRHSYDAHSDEELMLGAVDDNHKDVAEYLRVCLTPTLCVKSYYDDSLPQSAPKLQSVEEQKFLAQVEAIKRFTACEQKDFLRQLQLTEQLRRKDVSGYAIDLHSFISATSHGYGLHDYATRALMGRLTALQELREHRKLFSPNDINCRIARGLLHWKEDGHAIPILRLTDIGDRSMDNISTEMLRELGRHLLSQHSFIPVDCDGRIIDGEYEYAKQEGDE